MKFDITPHRARPIASAIADYLEAKEMRVAAERAPWPNAPYRPTLTAQRAGRLILVEAQEDFALTRGLKDLAGAMAIDRRYAELYVATDAAAAISATALGQLRAAGIGWYAVGSQDAVTVNERALNWALVVNVEPTLTLGPCRREVQEILEKFNKVNRKDGLRDMCELVEREVEALGVLAVRKGLLTKPEAVIRRMDLATQINTLSAGTAYAVGSPLVEEGLKTDLHAFREARNLVDHPVAGRRDDARRAMKYHDKMVAGARLIAELMTLKRRVSRRSSPRPVSTP